MRIALEKRLGVSLPLRAPISKHHEATPPEHSNFYEVMHRLEFGFDVAFTEPVMTVRVAGLEFQFGEQSAAGGMKNNEIVATASAQTICPLARPLRAHWIDAHA